MTCCLVPPLHPWSRETHFWQTPNHFLGSQGKQLTPMLWIQRPVRTERHRLVAPNTEDVSKLAPDVLIVSEEATCQGTGSPWCSRDRAALLWGQDHGAPRVPLSHSLALCPRTNPLAALSQLPSCQTTQRPQLAECRRGEMGWAGHAHKVTAARRHPAQGPSTV